MSAAVEAIPYLLLGERQRASLQDVLAQRLSSWRQKWSASAAPISVEVPESVNAGWAHVPATRARVFSAIADGISLMHVQPCAAFLPSLLGLEQPLGHSAPAEGEIAGQVRIETLRSLCASVLQGVVTPQLEFDEAVDTQPTSLAAARRQRALPVEFQIGSTGGRCTIVLHAAVVAGLIPARQRSMLAPLDRKLIAIGEERLHVQASLGEVEVSLAELASLAEGDVLVLDKGLAEPADLLTDLGVRVSRVALGAAGSRRAVRVMK